MKRCPECRRDYYDDSLLYCLDDGAQLLEGPASGGGSDEPLTARLSGVSEHVTRKQEASTGRISVDQPGAGRSRWLVVALVALIAIAGLGYGLYKLIDGRSRQKTDPSDLKIQAMTQSGNVREAAISPDGRFLAYTENSNGKAAVWTKQISTNSKVQIAPPTEADYFALKFSQDGEYVYYGIYEGTVGVIYKVPTLGGTPVSVIRDVFGQVAFSPDGKQLAIQRYDLQSGESSVVIADADGGNERKLASLSGQKYFSAPSLSWSPDNNYLAVAVGDDNLEHAFVLAKLDATTGEATPLSTKRFDEVNNTVWRKDQNGILFVASDKGANLPMQIWEISLQTGETRQVTHDLTGYVQLSMTADGKNIVTVQRDSFSSIWFSDSGDPNKVQQISHGKQEGLSGMTLTANGRVVYVSTLSGSTEIWSMNSDGTDARQMTNDGISKYTPAVTPDGRYIVYVSEKGGKHLWRANADGSQPIQLTNGSEDGNPRISPDGKWIVFDSFRGGTLALWRISIDGGEPVALNVAPALEPDVSPDGKFIACFFLDQQNSKNVRLIVVPFNGGAPSKVIDVPQTVFIDMSPQWTRDGKGITYIDSRGDQSNLWVQPLDGSKPRQLTNITNGYIYRREWNRDGTKLAIVKGTETSDAVMLTGF